MKTKILIQLNIFVYKKKINFLIEKARGKRFAKILEEKEKEVKWGQKKKNI